MSMPCSTIRYRPIYATRQIAPITLRTSKQQQSHVKVLLPTATVSWHVSFCAGMILALVFLLCGHFV